MGSCMRGCIGLDGVYLKGPMTFEKMDKGVNKWNSDGPIEKDVVKRR